MPKPSLSKRILKPTPIAAMCLLLIPILFFAINFFTMPTDSLWGNVVRGDKDMVQIADSDRYELKGGQRNRLIIWLEKSYLFNIRLNDEDEIRQAEKDCLLAFTAARYEFGKRQKALGEVLLKRGYDLEATCSDGYTALQHSVVADTYYAIPWLIENGANPLKKLPPNRQQYYGQLSEKTPIEAAKWLVKKK